jgi:hypothetical protein
VHNFIDVSCILIVGINLTDIADGLLTLDISVPTGSEVITRGVFCPSAPRHGAQNQNPVYLAHCLNPSDTERLKSIWAGFWAFLKLIAHFSLRDGPGEALG